MSGEVGIEIVDGPEEALQRLDFGQYDLVITRWGHDGERGPDGQPISLAERLLTGMRQSDLRAPVLVFAGAQYANVNKPRAMALGAADYTFSWDGLFRSIENVLRPATGVG